jgi:hypothetical protein
VNRIAIALLAMLLASAMASPTARASNPLREGQPFPDLLLPSLADGRPTSIAAFRGKKVILHIFASW